MGAVPGVRPTFRSIKQVLSARARLQDSFKNVHFWCPDGPFGTNRNVPNGPSGTEGFKNASNSTLDAQTTTFVVPEGSWAAMRALDS